MRTLVRGAADFVYPPACRLCTADLPERTVDAPDHPFCDDCRRELLATGGSSACVHCGATIGPYLDPQSPCSFCRNEHYAFERVIRLGVYDGLLRTACLRAKTRGAEALASGLAELHWELHAPALRDAGIDVVVPVPQHWARRVSRAHHAADTLAAVWGRRLKVPCAPHILRKARWTRPQARLSPHERRVNLKNAFLAVRSSDLAGAVVLLADDVMTTGATAHETARVLKQAGVARVVVAVIARGLGRR